MMIDRRNPYRPGAGLPPPHLAGRSDARRKLALAQSQIEGGDGASPIVITGLRGMGKTVLLGHLRAVLVESGWLAPNLGRFANKRRLGTVWRTMRQEIVRIQPHELIPREPRAWDMDEVRWKAGAELGTGGAKARAEVGGKVVRRDEKELQREAVLRDLAMLGEQASKRGTRVVLMFDEAQDAETGDLSVLAEIGQSAGERAWPLLIVFAGLNPLRDKLLKAGTFATRFPSVKANNLERDEAKSALSIPARDQGVTWDGEALEQAVDWAAGIPYHVQVIGQASWEGLGDGRISVDAVASAVSRAREEVESAMYEPLWNRASGAEQNYLVAMSYVGRRGDGFRVRDILERLGKRHSDAATLRQRLVDKGLIHGLRYGLVDFSYPGFGDYVRKQPTG